MISHIRDKTLFLELCPTLSVTQPMGMILGVVLSRRVGEVNESPKFGSLPGEIRKDDCHNGLLVRSLGIMRWARESSRHDSLHCSQDPVESDQLKLDHPS